MPTYEATVYLSGKTTVSFYHGSNDEDEAAEVAAEMVLDNLNDVEFDVEIDELGRSYGDPDQAYDEDREREMGIFYPTSR